MKKYTAINIGPIIPTFDMARKPRELWAASYLFSYLMKCIIDKINAEEGIDVFSPVVKEDMGKKGVGLYPDRVYCKGCLEDFTNFREVILQTFAEGLSVDDDFKDDFKDYFNIMCVSIEKNEDQETKAIKEMNHLLDCLELNGRTTSNKSREAIYHYITSKNSNLIDMAFEMGRFAVTSSTVEDSDEGVKTTHYGSLAEYASIQLTQIGKTNGNGNKARRDASIEEDDSDKVQEDSFWNKARKGARIEKDDSDKAFMDIQEDSFFRRLKEYFPDDIKSYHKYICIVQADGDNIGKTFSHHGLKNGKTSEISSELVQFNVKASSKIYEYGGFPIYAGGDDLLFLAPVVGATETNKNIFDLLNEIDECFKPVKDKVMECKLRINDNINDETENNNNIIIPSMSYGVSITYYKFPLYEALKSARHLLFDVAKQVDGKNAIAWNLQKNSGSSFSGAFTKTELLDSFENVIRNSQVKDTIVSAVSHKIRANQTLLQLWIEDNDSYRLRNANFFKNYLEYEEGNAYKKSVLDLLNKLFEVYIPKFKAIDNENIEVLPKDRAQGINTEEEKKSSLKQDLCDQMFKMTYSMIRTAKFINGEEVRDE